MTIDRRNWLHDVEEMDLSLQQEHAQQAAAEGAK